MDVVVWLRSLGLGKYEAAFRENDIDETVLPGLTHEILKELGVSSVGHRMKLLDAIAARRGERAPAAPSSDLKPAPAAESPFPEDRAERRQVTVVFSDLVGSTALSARMDPEDLREVISAYQKCVAETVGKFDGYVAKYMGDGVLVYFGNPALQAVLMALEMRDAIGALTETWRRWGHEIGFGIGISHGFATLGTIGFEGRFDYAAIGTVSNVASRLCDEAKPGQILISPRVLTKVENAVKVEPVGEFELKGIRRPLAAYNVVGAVL